MTDVGDVGFSQKRSRSPDQILHYFDVLTYM